MSVVSAIVGWFIHSRQKLPKDTSVESEEDDSSNPLEFKVALIFAVLFVVFYGFDTLYFGLRRYKRIEFALFCIRFQRYNPFYFELIAKYGERCRTDYYSLQYAGDCK